MDTSIPTETLHLLLGSSADPVAAGWRLRELAENSVGRGAELLSEVSRQSDLLAESDPAILGGLLRVLHTTLVQTGPDSLTDLDPALLVAVESAIPAATPNRHLLLQLLAMIRSRESLTMLMQSLRDNPPKAWIEGAQLLSPLMQHSNWDISAVFPAALDCLQHPSLAAPLLDLANYLTRSGQVSAHPAADRLPTLNLLLGEVSGRLGQFEDDPHAFGDDVDTVQSRLGEAVALAVSLCDAVGLIGDESSIGKLNQTVNLRHRRVQCEAAGASPGWGMSWVRNACWS